MNLRMESFLKKQKSTLVNYTEMGLGRKGGVGAKKEAGKAREERGRGIPSDDLVQMD